MGMSCKYIQPIKQPREEDSVSITIILLDEDAEGPSAVSDVGIWTFAASKAML